MDKTTGHIIAMARPNVRERLLDAGVEIFHRCGFNGCGCRRSPRPQAFPRVRSTIISRARRRSARRCSTAIGSNAPVPSLHILEDSEVRPRERLRRHFAAMAANMAKRGYTGGCLIGNLGAELSDHSKLVCEASRRASSPGGPRRSKPASGRPSRRATFSADCDAGVLAAFLINAWEGAVLRAKVDKNAVPFEEFDEVVFGKLLASASNPMRN